MKKLVLIIATLAITFPGMAQDKYVTSALTALKGQNYEEAKEDIDKAMTNPETKDKPKALFAKAQIYFVMIRNGGEKYASQNLYREAAQALFRLIEVKPDYEKASVDQLLFAAGFYYFNDGVKAYNDKHYPEAADLMKNVTRIYDMKDTRKFEGMPNPKVMDTIAANAYQTLAYSQYYSQKYEEAIPALIKVKNNPITKSASVYAALITAYDKKGSNTEKYATIEEGRKAFPEDVTLRNYELNYFIASGKQDELIKKLEEAAAKEPGNADILFNIATTYLGMSADKDGKKPANAADLLAKSEDAFQRALKLSPDNAGYNYNFGALYYNQATDLNNQMNAITGTSAADLAKYDALKVKRDAMFGKSMPYFEKAYSWYAANESSIKAEDMATYKSTILALKEVYARQSKLDDSKRMKTKYESMN